VRSEELGVDVPVVGANNIRPLSGVENPLNECNILSQDPSTSHSSLLTLPPVAEMMRDAGLEPKKQYGQNFLFDLNLTDKIARAVPDIENCTVVEVGPGPGGLTRSLLAAGAKKVIAIEKDKTTAPILEKISTAANGRLEVVFGDAVKLGVGSEELGVDDYAICSNLPYNIGTELLVRWIHLMANQFLTPHSPLLTSMTLMFQKEVADRIVAKQGDPAYGRLSVLVALTADAKILFNVPNTAFFPKPRVQSAVVQIKPKAQSPKPRADLEKIENFTAKIFGQRRKMIRGIIKDVDWQKFGLTGTERAEDLSPEKIAEIATKIVVE
jgi:16S rRNA (adenine1518-N6/adenine1519-N6)-dimethyltransferase